MCHGDFHDHHAWEITSTEVEKQSELEHKIQKDHRKIEKNAATKKVAAHTESESAKAQAEENAAARANCDNAEAKTEEVERICTGSMMNVW